MDRVSPVAVEEGAVDSVNGETGVVSLGIQEMDDFGLNVAASQSLVYGAGNSSGVSSIDANGEFSRGTVSLGGYPSNSKALAIYALDDNGDSLATMFAGYTDADPSGCLTTAKQLTQYATVGFAAWFGFTDVYALLSDGLYDDLSTLRATPLLITLQDPNTITYDPLADGDFLQWVDAEQKFKPAQLQVGTTIENPLTSESGYLTWTFKPSTVPPRLRARATGTTAAATSTRSSSAPLHARVTTTLLYDLTPNNQQITAFVNGVQVFQETLPDPQQEQQPDRHRLRFGALDRRPARR